MGKDKLFERAKSVPIREMVEDGRKVENAGAGKERVNPCPLCDHKDCFTIFSADNSFYCYSCEKGGTVVDFVMHRDGIEAKAAAELLTGDRPNLEPYVPPLPAPEEKAPGIYSERAFAVREFAAQLFYNNLLSDAEALAYQEEARKHPRSLLSQERVGLSKGNLLEAGKRAGFSPEEFEAVGLAGIKYGKWKEYFFSGMFLYPHKAQGKVIWFTAKDPRKKYKGQIYKKFKPESWLCYGQDELKNTQLFICEGENDRLSLLRAVNGGVVAINATAANKTLIPWLKQNGEGKTVYLCFDGDDAGRKYAKAFGDAALAGGAKVFRLEFPDKTDVDDFIRGAKDAREAMGGKIKEAVEILPAHEGGNGNGNGKPVMPDFYDDLHFESVEPIAELRNGDLLIWNKLKLVTYRVKLREFTYEQFIQVAGKEGIEKVSATEKGALEHGKLFFRPVKVAMINQAGKRLLHEPRFFGQGVHSLKSGNLLIVNGAEAWVFDGKDFTPQLHPLLPNDDGLIRMEPGRIWIDMREVIRLFKGMTPETGRKVVECLKEKIDQWLFAGTLDVSLLAGFFLAQIVQSVWEWRPHLWFTGPSNSGKSVFCRYVQDLLGKIVLDCEATTLTEPGLRQFLSDDSTLPIIDEFENSPDRDKIIVLLRSAGRGGTGRKGSADGKGVSYTMRHMAFVASVSIGMNRAAENSRFLVVNTLQDEKRRAKMMSAEETVRVRNLMVAYALWAIRQAKGLISSLSGEINRDQEAAAVPLSMVAVTAAGDREQQLRAWIKTYEDEFKRVNGGALYSDEESLLLHILDSRIRLPKIYREEDRERVRDIEMSIAEAIFNAELRNENSQSWGEILNGYGVKYYNNGESIFFYPAAIQRYLLKHSPWDGVDVKQILLRVPGAEYKKGVLGGRRPWGVMIPMDYFKEKEMFDESIGGQYEQYLAPTGYSGYEDIL